MKFVDEATITVVGGRGGAGCLSFRREKFLPRGGPDGGNGGKGGDVVLAVESGLNTLAEFRYTRTFKAKNGSSGSGKNRNGAGGSDCRVDLPIGTLIFDADTEELISDMTLDHQQFVVAHGGKGGVGNAAFKSSTNRSPRKILLGRDGDERRLRLELQVLADVGLLGLPNAGKSRFLTMVSEAKPKVAEYPFTTLYPELGMVECSSDGRFVIADIPGLIAGAAQGVGLGTRFLRHLRRTRLLLHLVDISTGKFEDAMDEIRIIDQELEEFDPDLAKRPRWLVFNKIDLLEDNEVEQVRSQVTEGIICKGAPTYLVSAATGQGCSSLAEDVFFWLDHHDALVTNYEHQ